MRYFLDLAPGVELFKALADTLNLWFVGYIGFTKYDPVSDSSLFYRLKMRVELTLPIKCIHDGNDAIKNKTKGESIRRSR